MKEDVGLGEGLKVFISYAHEDRVYKDTLLKHLKGLVRRKLIVPWADHAIDGGDEWHSAIARAMDECEIAILLVSADFIASDFIHSAELSRLLTRRERNGIRVVPIIAKPCRWQSEDIGRLQALPEDGKPIQVLDRLPGGSDETWAAIAAKIEHWASNRTASLVKEPATVSPVSIATMEFSDNSDTHDEFEPPWLTDSQKLQKQDEESRCEMDRDLIAPEVPCRLSHDQNRVVPGRQSTNAVLNRGTIFRDRLKDGSEGPEMVEISPGSFSMGDLLGRGLDYEMPVHEVRILRPFAMGRYPVTFEEYDRFVRLVGKNLPDDYGWGRGRRPVLNVSWWDSQDFAAWLTEQTGQRYRLPTEAEWEYAARAGTRSEYWWGNEFDRDRANGDYSNRKTTLVGKFPPNSWSLSDTAGNVWEWLQDRWHSNYDGAPSDGSAWEIGNDHRRVIRGGSWGDYAQRLRSSSRGASRPDGAISMYRGFRLVRDL